MRLIPTGIPSVRLPERTRIAPRKSGWLTQAFLLLLVLVGSTWSHQAFAARAICVLTATSPTSQTGATGSTLSYSFTADNGFACGAASGTVTIDPRSDTTGGATISSGATFNDAGAAPFTNNFSLTLGPNPGSVSLTVTCTSFECAGATLPYTATALTPAWTVVASVNNADNDGSGSVTPGDLLNYSVVVKNTSGNGLSLTNVTIRDSRGANTACGTIADGSSCTLPNSYVVQAADVNTTLNYLGNARSTEIGGRVGQNSNTVSSVVVAAAPGMRVDKSVLAAYVDADNSGNISPGDTLTYQLVATNTGNVKLSSVVLSDRIVPSLDQNCPDLPRSGQPGDTCTVTGTYLVTPADAKNGSIVNTAVGNTSSGVGPLNSNTVTTPVFASPSVNLTKTRTGYTDNDNSGNVTVGDVINYTIAAKNTGGSSLTNLVITDTNALPSSFNCPTPLTVGSICSFTTTQTVTGADLRAGHAVNRASATSDQITTAVLSNQVVTAVNAGPSVAVTKTFTGSTDADNSGNVTVGDTLDYQIVVQNNGGGTLTNVVLADPNAVLSATACPSLAINATCTWTATHVVTNADLKAGQATNKASATSDQITTGIASNTVNTPIAATPSVTVTKTFTGSTDPDKSGNVTVGDTLDYQIVVKNTGGGTLTNVVLADANATVNPTSCLSLAVNATCTWTATHVVTNADLKAGQATNKASATSDQITTGTVSNTVNTLVAASPAMNVAKILSGNTDPDKSGTVTENDVLTYTVTATNKGGSALTNVTVTDPLTNPSSNFCANVPINGSCTLQGTYQVSRKDVNAGNINNTGNAVSDQFPAGKSSSLNTKVFTSPKATVTKVLTHNNDGDHSGTITVGDILTYTVTGTNAGNVVLASMTVSDPLTAPNSITCSNVAINGTCILNGIYTVTAADLRNGSINNTGSVSSPQLRVPVTANLVTPVSATPAMTITKVLTSNADGDHSGTVTVGDVLTYTVTATNSGNVALTGVNVSDPLTAPSTFGCANVAIGGTCALVGTYTVTATDASKGSISNTGSATARQLTKPVQASLITPVSKTAPGLSVSKVLANNADGDHSGTVSQGDVLTYTVTATNSGSEILGNVQVTDPLTSPSAASCTTLAIGASCVLTGTYTVTSTDVRNGTISNTGTATSNQIKVGIVSNTVTTPVVTTTSMSVTKVLAKTVDKDHSGDITPGDVLTFTVTALNTGNVVLNSVTVNDPLTSPSTTNCPNVPANGTCVLTGTYTVSANDATNGSISNTGSATAAGQIITPVTQTLNTPVAALNRTITIVSGDNQSGPQNSALPASLVVSVLDNSGQANGVTVKWAVTSGTATLAHANTLVAGGQASNDVTLGANPGPVTITATRADDPTKSVTFHATVTAPTLSIVSGNNQIGVVGADAAQPVVVRLLDGSGHPFANQPVTWQVVSGPASLKSSTPLTDNNGNAQATFAYGASTGAIVIRASAGGSSVDFDESSQSYRITILGGNNQTAAPGQPLPQDFAVQVSYPAGMTTLATNHAGPAHAPPTLAGVAIQWNVTAGGGSLSQGNNTLTDANGRASNHYTLGTGTGLNQVQVVVPGGNSTTFSANSAATNAVLKIVSGSGQDLPPNTDSQALVVQLTDNGIPLANVTVNWSATNATLNAATTLTDGTGHATNTAKVTNIGAASVTASTSAPATSPVAFGLNGGLSFIGGITPVEGQIGGALDNGCAALAAMSSLTPAQQDLLKQCNALSSSAGSDPGQALHAIDQMFSDEAYLETSAAMLISTTQFDNVKARIAALRSGTGGDHFGGLAFATPDGTLPVGSVSTSALSSTAGTDKDKDKQDVGSGFDRWGFFLSGTFSHGSADPRQSLPGYGFNTNGVTGGVDYRFSDKFIAGVSAGYAKYRSDLDAGIGSMNTSGWTLSAYSTFFQKDNWYLDGVLTWGSNSYDLSRKIAYTLTGPSGTTTVNQVANGNDSGTTLAAAVTFGRDFNKGPWSFGPYFRGTWTRVDFDGYQEKLQAGPGMGLGLAVQTHPLKSEATVLGAKINYASSQSWGVMMPHAEVEWQHEFQDNPDTITAHFLQDPTQTPINVNGFPVDNSFFRVGLGVSFVFPHGRSGFVYYEKTLGRSGITQDSIALGLRVEF